ncbi:MAG: (d)CMP kinase [Phycisphaeraceae bacterium]
MQRLIVTLDGPAGSGKSTVARELAQRLGVEFLDTGAMYRGIAAKALGRGIDLVNEGYAVVELARHCEIRFDWSTSPPRLSINGVDVTDRLRDPDVTRHASDVAGLAGVRQVLVEAQRRIGREHPRLVTEGRDQGSVVFPDADVKFYLDARAAVRAQRRADQIRATGRHADLEAIRDAIIARDYKDSNRADGPLICPDDARRIDTSDMNLEKVVDLLEQRVRETVETAA